MPPPSDSLVAALMERAEAAAEAARETQSRAAGGAVEAERLRERARILRAFVARVRREPTWLPLRCAWCGRIQVEDDFVDVDASLDGDLPERLRERSTHGICPDCLEREQEFAERIRDDGRQV